MSREILRIPGLRVALTDAGWVAFSTCLGNAELVIYISTIQDLRAISAAIDVAIHDKEKRAREVKKKRSRHQAPLRPA